MTDPVRLRVLEHVRDTIAGMSRAGGYSLDPRPGSVILDPIDLLNVPDQSLPVFVVAPDERGSRRTFHLNRRVQAVMSLLITGAVLADGFRVDEKIRAAERALGDLERALCVDPTRGGAAVLTRVLEPLEPHMAIGSDRRVLVLQPVEVLIERRYGEP